MNPTSFWLHMAGIPACFIAAPILLVLKQWWPAAAAFVGGYVLQFIGHAIEGNQSGEEMLFRRIFGANTTSAKKNTNGTNENE